MTEYILMMFFSFFIGAGFFALFENKYINNFKFYYFFKISGIVYFFMLMIFDVSDYIIMYKTHKPSIKIEATDFYAYILSISFFIIGLLFEILEGQKIIRGDIRFKVGDVYFYTNDETNSFEIEKIKDVDIHLSYLKFEDPSWEKYGLRKREIKKISKFLRMIDEGIITKRFN